MKFLMNKPIRAFIMILMIVCFTSTAFAYTYDSEIDPVEFSNWTELKVDKINDVMIVELENQKANAKIKKATVKVDSQNYIISYEYVVDGKIYKYELNRESHNYDLVKPAEQPAE